MDPDSLRCLQLAYAADSGMLDYLSRNSKNRIGIFCQSVFAVSADSERPRPVKVVEVSRLVEPVVEANDMVVYFQQQNYPRSSHHQFPDGPKQRFQC